MHKSVLIKMRKGQGLSLQTVIVAALVLLVLIILIAIFTGRMSLFGQSASECETKGGICQKPINDDVRCGPGMVELTGSDCKEKDKICCKQI